MAELVLTEIWTYPIKSLGGVQSSTARVLEKGLALDRRWMLIDDQGQFMTQRQFPSMALFRLSVEADHLSVRLGSDQIHIPYAPLPSVQTIQARVWDDEVTVTTVGDDHDRWFTKHLGVECRLVFFPEINSRSVDPVYQRHGEQVSLADGYPYLIIGQASLDALNERLTFPLPMNRFRPNFVFSGGAPNEEDSWKDFTVGEVSFAGVKPCARCSIPTVDQDTGERSAEPTRTLATYRKQNNKIYFGQNLLALSRGTVKVGDRIAVKAYHAVPSPA